MKHVEQIKSFVLFLLVFLSLILTFSIWNYTPDYQTIEDPQVEKIKIGSPKELSKVLKPYRVLTHQDENLVGTTSNSAINTVMDALADLNVMELNEIQSNISQQEINNMIHSENHMTLFFSGEIPINTFRSLIHFDHQNELSEFAFSHLLIDWSRLDDDRLELSFISKEKQALYSTVVSFDHALFEHTFKRAIQQSVAYEEIQRHNKLSLYVPADPADLVQYSYYIDEISPEKFKGILFKDADLVIKTKDSNNTYTDWMAVMTTDSLTKSIHYVYPTRINESFNTIKHSELIQNSYDFINEHGGFTGDYRYSNSNVQGQVINYQLYLQGLPIFSSETLTRIEMKWGESLVLEYIRPYYSFGVYESVYESSTRRLPSGVEKAATLENINQIDDLVLGYFLTPDPFKPKVYTLEPSWFTILNGEGTRLLEEPVGGAKYGLE